MIEFIAAENRAVMEFTGKPEMCHSGDVVQGGFVTAWIDSAMARAAMLATEGALAPATLEIKVSFFRARQSRTGTRGGMDRADGSLDRLSRRTPHDTRRRRARNGDVDREASADGPTLKRR